METFHFFACFKKPTTNFSSSLQPQHIYQQAYLSVFKALQCFVSKCPCTHDNICRNSSICVQITFRMFSRFNAKCYHCLLCVVKNVRSSTKFLVLCSFLFSKIKRGCISNIVVRKPKSNKILT